jgi:hypothetical protein
MRLGGNPGNPRRQRTTNAKQSAPDVVGRSNDPGVIINYRPGIGRNGICICIEQ